MPNEKFVLVSLQDDKAKKLAQVITNDSCRKILDYLAEKDATESELSTKLFLPISTVHYNLKQLVDGGLVKSEEFHYSEKGKEVNHYRLANKYIIIAPKGVYGIKEKLKSILPVVLIVGAGAAFIQLFVSKMIRLPMTTVFSTTKQTIVQQTIIGAQEKAIAPMAAPLAGGAADMVRATAAYSNETIQQIANITTEHSLRPETTVRAISNSGSAFGSIAIWFLIGSLTALGAYLLVDYFRQKK